MILKKPYAFIIRHFRAIHLILLVPLFYLAIKTKAINSFLYTYIMNSFKLPDSAILSNLASNYINILMYICLIFVLVVLIFIAFILQDKEKPTKFYKYSILFYMGLLVAISLCFGLFKMIENDTLNPAIARIVKDASLIIYIAEWVWAILILIRGTGFNIKKFNFQNDIMNMQINSEDSEEFEFVLKNNSYERKRKLRRFKREFIYYYKENKFIFSAIFVIIIIILISSMYRNKTIYNPTYSEGVNIAFGYLNLLVQNSNVATLDLNGKVLDESKAYVILNIKLANRYQEDKNFNYANLLLKVNNNAYSPDLTLGNYFLDYGIPFSGITIKGNSSNSFILVYAIPRSDMNKRITVDCNYGYSHKTINLRPVISGSNIFTSNINKGTNISLTNTNLKQTNFSILDYSIQNNFSYTYNYCYKDECRDLINYVGIDYSKDSGKTLLSIDYILNLDSETPYMISNKSYMNFFSDFLEIKYIYNNKEKTVKADVINTPNYTDSVILKVPKEISNASKIAAVLTFRNYAYIINLK